MPKYTTSYSNKRTKQFTQSRNRSRNGLGKLPSSRRNARRRSNSSYLKRSQGFGKAARRQSYRGNDRAPMAFVAIGCAFVVFITVIVWYMNRGVDITLNDETVSVRVNSSIEKLISDQGFDDSTKAGNLLAVDDSVLEKGGGERYAITLDGKKVDDADIAATKLEGGEVVTIESGDDVYEEHDVAATEIEPTITVTGSGAISYVKTWGVPGRSEVWTGKKSGLVYDRGVVQEVVNCEVVSTSVSPADKKSKVVALTFDEGPSSGTQNILSILEEKGVKATFFLEGDKVEANSSAAAAIVNAGHEVGSNSYSDTDLTALSGSELRNQLTSGFDAIEAATGQGTAMLRAPYGSFSEENWAEAMDLVSVVVTWNLDSGDWLLNGADDVVDTVVNGASSGDVILLTDNEATTAQTAEALPQIIDGLQEKGFTIVPLSELVTTDEDLAEDLKNLSKVSMPSDAVLPSLAQDTDTTSTE